MTVRIALPAIDPLLLAGFLGLGAAALAAAGTTFFGAALPKLGFAASLERAATAGPALVFARVAFDRVALPLAGAGFLAMVSIELFPHAARLPCPG
ncbi:MULTISPECIES: hypothetical protein [unclassified Mesorhizobium]|uniref:hypothetical protein n=1 Tax=unclassified Mesorhizobium TaxID=325217 RepID=UPI003338556A